jgi:hypothetical protein
MIKLEEITANVKYVLQWIRKINVNKHFFQLSGIAVLLIIILLIIRNKNNNEAAIIQNFEYISSIIDDNEEDLQTYFYADKFLKESLYNFLSMYPEKKRIYLSDYNYRIKIERAHSLKYYIKTKNYSFIKKLAVLQNTCNCKQYVIDYDSLISGKTRFITLKEGLKVTEKYNALQKIK